MVTRKTTVKKKVAKNSTTTKPVRVSSQETEVTAILAIIFTFVFVPVGLILAIVALQKIKNNPSLGGKALAQVALILSIIFIGLPLLLVFIGALAFLGAMTLAMI